VSLLNEERRPSRLRGGVVLIDSRETAAEVVSICNCGRGGDDEDGLGLEVSNTCDIRSTGGEGGGDDIGEVTRGCYRVCLRGLKSIIRYDYSSQRVILGSGIVTFRWL